MHYLFVKLFDCIFPPRDTLVRVRGLTHEIIRAKYCLSIRNDLRILAPYADLDIRALIHEAKFRGNTKAFTLLNTLFAEYLSEISTQYDVIIPIPLPAKRMRERGYNQIYEILCVRDIGVPINTKVLRRIRYTRPQTELKKKERLTNIRDAFGVTDVELLQGKHVLVVDDVTTTGATLQEAKRALQVLKPASVTCLAIAH